jgi:hypothetical protein
VAYVTAPQTYSGRVIRRAFANSIKGAPLRDQKDLGGWKTTKTLVDIYQAAE